MGNFSEESSPARKRLQADAPPYTVYNKTGELGHLILCSVTAAAGEATLPVTPVVAGMRGKTCSASSDSVLCNLESVRKCCALPLKINTASPERTKKVSILTD